LYTKKQLVEHFLKTKIDLGLKNLKQNPVTKGNRREQKIIGEVCELKEQKGGWSKRPVSRNTFWKRSLPSAKYQKSVLNRGTLRLIFKVLFT